MSRPLANLDRLSNLDSVLERAETVKRGIRDGRV